MKLVIPRTTPYEIKRKHRGIKVWAIQRALNGLDYGPLVEDGIFGRKTEDMVLAYQISKVLYQDGIFGPKSSASVAAELTGLATQTVRRLPAGLLRSIVEGESGNLIAAVNWSVSGGVDCGYTQRRVYEADYEEEEIVKRAFDSSYQIKLLARGLRSRHDSYFGKPGATSHEQAWRLAVLHHNYPAATERIVAAGIGGLTSYYTTPQAWVAAIGAKFPDGEPVRTPLDWCQHYALGNPAHQEPGRMTKYAEFRRS